jgi:hypothetical protein
MPAWSFRRGPRTSPLDAAREATAAARINSPGTATFPAHIPSKNGGHSRKIGTHTAATPSRRNEIAPATIPAPIQSVPTTAQGRVESPANSASTGGG